MTVEVYSSPGTSAWQSTLYTATVNGSAAYVYGHSRTTVAATDVWSASQSVELSWLTYGSDATTTVVVSKTSGSITSAIVYPNDDSVTQSIAGGALTLTIPTNTRLRVEINGDRANALFIFASPLKVAVPGSTTNWTAVTSRTVSSINTGTETLTLSSAHGWSAGQQVVLSTTGSFPTVSGTALSAYEPYYVLSPSGADLKLSRTSGGTAIDFTSSGSGTMTVKQASWSNTSSPLYFGAGVHTIGRLFDLASNVTVYIDGGAVVIGSFDLRGCDGVTIEGPGVLSGTFATAETVAAITDFSTKIGYAMFLGYDGSKFNFDNAIQGITVVNTPFYLTYYGAWSWRNMHMLSPWYWNSDGLDPAPRSSGNDDAELVDCFVFAGDDACRSIDNYIDLTVSGCFFSTAQGGCILLSYWNDAPETDASKRATFTDCHALHIGLVDTEGDDTYPIIGGNTIVKLWLDGHATSAYSTYGRYGVDFTNLNVWGPIASRLLSFENRAYPFGDSSIRSQFGNASDINFDGLTLEYEPGQESRIKGFDWANTPHDLSFSDFTVAGQRVTHELWSNYVDSEGYAYNITLGGYPLTTKLDMVNLALSHIGEGVQVTSIAPPDGSAAATAASRFWSTAVTMTLGLMAWPFATKRAVLVEATNDRDGQWQYAYEIPDDCMRVLGIVPTDARDDYVQLDNRPIRYQVEVSESGEQLLYTDLEDAEIRYTFYEDDPNAWTLMFQQAFAWQLASLLAGTIVKGDQGVKMADYCLQRGLSYAKAAAADSSSKREATPFHRVPWFMGGVPNIPPARIQG